jgi:hypothetical protein
MADEQVSIQMLSAESWNGLDANPAGMGTFENRPLGPTI